MQANSSEKVKLLSIASHASIFISTLVFSVGIPIAILVISDDSVIKENAKEAINFHFNVWFLGIIVTILSVITFGLLGWVLGPLLILYTWVFSIWAILFCIKNTEQPFSYPFIFRLL